MTTGKPLQIIGLGPSAISQLDHALAQNAKSSRDWRTALANDLATVRGLHLSDDDRLRRELLNQLYGHGRIEKSELDRVFDIEFDEYFESEMRLLRDMEEERLAILEPDRISLTPVLGRLLVRVVAAIFDRYLPENSHRTGLPPHLASKVG
jgi:oxygen-independent coproporphyrinogen-3 oxidase